MQVSYESIKPAKFMHIELEKAQETKYQQLHFLTRHLISIFLHLQSVYIKETNLIDNPVPFSRFINLAVEAENELDELRLSLENYKICFGFPFMDHVLDNYKNFFNGYVENSKYLLHTVKYINIKKQIQNSEEAKEAMSKGNEHSERKTVEASISTHEEGVPEDDKEQSNVFAIILKLCIEFNPLRFTPEPPVIEESTRLLREFGSLNFFRVEFGKIYNVEQVQKILISGFFFAGNYWVYFGEATGQLTTNSESGRSCWFCSYNFVIQENQKTINQSIGISRRCLQQQVYESNSTTEEISLLRLLPENTSCKHSIIMDNAYYQSEERVEMITLKELKMNSTYFRQKCIDWLGDFEHIKLVCKISSREGLCLGKSYSTINLQGEETKLVICNDMESQFGAYTDGCGEISWDLMERIAEQLNRFQPSKEITAVQFRFRGCKGMLEVNPFLQSNTIILNQSQIKFSIPFPTDEENFLEVVNIAESTEGYLNEEIIVLLEALGVNQSFFLKILEENLKGYENVMQNKEQLEKIAERKKFDMDGELFYKMSLANIYYNDIVELSYLEEFENDELSKMEEKFRIKLQESSFLYGVYDVLRLLDKDEVYINPSDINGAVAAEVVIAKNPCTHGGNIRKMKVADIIERIKEKLNYCDETLLSQIENMYNGVIVFPVVETDERYLEIEDYYSDNLFEQRQEDFRPISDELGGSDLDGDIYFVTWNQEIVASFEPIEPEKIFFNEEEIQASKGIVSFPLELYGSEAEEQSLQYEYDLLHSQIEWLSNRLVDNSLGIIGNTLSVAGDIFGYNHKISSELSRCFNLAVDQDKNGWILTNQTKELINSVENIDISSVEIRNNTECQNLISDLLEINAPVLKLEPHFFLAKAKKISPQTLYFKSTSIRGLLYDRVENEKERLQAALKSVVFNHNVPYLPDRRLYFKAISQKIGIDGYESVNSLATIKIPEGVFEKNYSSVYMISHQYALDVAKCPSFRLANLKQYYEEALFDNFSLNECVARAVWFYFLVYNYCNRHYGRKNTDSDDDSSSQSDTGEPFVEGGALDEVSNLRYRILEEYYEDENILITKGLSFIAEAKNDVCWEEFSSRKEIVDNCYEAVKNEKELQAIKYLSIVHPTDVIFYENVNAVIEELELSNKRLNLWSLSFRAKLSKAENEVNELFSGRQPIEESFESEEQNADEPELVEKAQYYNNNLATVDIQKLEGSNYNVRITGRKIIVTPCEYHEGFTISSYGLNNVDYFISNDVLLKTAENCWAVGDEYLFLAFCLTGKEFITVSTEEYKALSFAKLKE